jgi:hypothetical protein
MPLKIKLSLFQNADPKLKMLPVSGLSKFYNVAGGYFFEALSLANPLISAIL